MKHYLFTFRWDKEVLECKGSCPHYTCYCKPRSAKGTICNGLYIMKDENLYKEEQLQQLIIDLIGSQNHAWDEELVVYNLIQCSLALNNHMLGGYDIVIQDAELLKSVSPSENSS